MMKIRPATREDIEAYSDAPGKPTLLAWAGEKDGRIIALGGIAYSKGRWFAFCDLDEEAKKYKMTIMRTAIRGLQEARRQGIQYIYAQADPNEPHSVAWMFSLGFVFDARVALFRWGP